MTTTTSKFHIGLHVSDIKKSINFYSDLFDTKPIKIKEDYGKFETDEVVLSLIQHPSGVKPGFGHFGLRLANDQLLIENQKRLQSKGYQLREEEHVACCYALQNKFWVKDPDGHEWEFYNFLEDVNQPELTAVVNDAENACCIPDCCN